MCVSPSKNQTGRTPIEWLEFRLEFTKQAILLSFLLVWFGLGLVWSGRFGFVWSVWFGLGGLVWFGLFWSVWFRALPG